MSTDERGPLAAYQITWASGHIETIEAHQVVVPMSDGIFSVPSREPKRVMFHGEIDGRWQLILSAPAAEIVTIRRLASSEVPQ